MPHRLRHSVFLLMAMCCLSANVNGQQLAASPELDVVSNVVSDIAAHLSSALRDQTSDMQPEVQTVRYANEIARNTAGYESRESPANIELPVVASAENMVVPNEASTERHTVALASHEGPSSRQQKPSRQLKLTQQIKPSTDTENGPDDAIVQYADEVSLQRESTLPKLTTADSTIDRRFPWSAQDTPASEGVPSLMRKLMMAMACAVCTVVLLTITTRYASSSRKPTDAGAMQLISTFRLAPRCTLSLLRIEGKSVLVSRDATGVRQLLVLQKDFESILDSPVDDVTPERI